MNKPKKKKILERDIQRNIKQFLQTTGWYVVKIHQGLGCHRGISDLIAVKGGVVLFLEVKTERGVLSEHQIKFCDEVRRRGGKYEVARSVNDVIEIVSEIKELK